MGALAILVGAVLLQLIIIGFNWQSVPFYVCISLPVILTIWRNAPQWSISLLAISMFFGFFLAGFLTITLPNFEIPTPTGTYSVGITDHQFANNAQVKIWYPATNTANNDAYGYLTDFDRPIMGLPPIIYSHLKGKNTHAFANAQAAAGRFPVIIYEHGADGHVEENTFLLTNLASHGFIVVAVVHKNTLANYELDLATLSAHPEQFLSAMTDIVMPDRKIELTYVVNNLAQINEAAINVQGRLDLSQIHFLGYSLGGGIVTDFCATTPICHPVINLDGNPFSMAHQTGLSAPYLHISQQVFLDMAAVEGPSSTVAEMGSLYQQDVQQVVKHTINNGFAADWLLLVDSGHASFTDMSYWINGRWGVLGTLFGTAVTESSHKTIQTVILSFLKDPSSIDSVKTRYAEQLVDFPD